MDASAIDLSGQVALVTGGGGGIGRAIALCMADMGANVAIIENIPERCEETAARIRALIAPISCFSMRRMSLRRLLPASTRARNSFAKAPSVAAMVLPSASCRRTGRKMALPYSMRSAT